ncbi:hypothetical protein OGAPHI_003129 [Ogataea philodendri]|uniref:PH domain-containing protein n=1 Tax=Ogataea philodendri TaxID=1378263 RepID=A0A9P8P9H5_9ASCO|nr:uncharacterized protein OGAPHI_003129 [Ogataea philodendri]KAH3667480.1 hypothetical protein OGAPHI_003129 [Ogataea philodendri]
MVKWSSPTSLALMFLILSSILTSPWSVNSIGSEMSSVPNASLIKLKLLECLRSSDKDKLRELITYCRSLTPPDPQIAALDRQVLIFAVQVAPLSIIEYIVQNKLVQDINAQDEQGNTALHYAAISARNDVINVLAAQDEINDCIVNKQMKQPIECSSNMDTVQVLSDVRTRFVEVKANELRNAFEARQFPVLEKLLSNPRVKGLLDINGTDPVTGDTVLLEFIKKDDIQMVKFILEHGGDPFKRNLNGKLPIDSATSSAMKKIMKDSCNHQTMIDSTNQTGQPHAGPPTFKGFLKKWTNFAGGYKLRWFILDAEGRLSYYSSPNDIYNSCRGMIHLASAQLRMDSSEKSKFEIIIKKRGQKSSLKWHLKANHVIETNRWVWALQNAIRYAKDLERQQRQSIADEQQRTKLSSRNKESFESTRSNSTQNIGNRGPHGELPTSPITSHQRSFSNTSSVSVSSDEEGSGPLSPNTNKSYKKPMRKLSKLTKKTKDAFSLPEIKENSDLKLPQQKDRSPSVGSFGSSGEAGSKLTISSIHEDDRDSALDDDDDDGSSSKLDFHDSSLADPEDIREPGLSNSELAVSKNQMKIELRSFGEFLTAAEADESIPKDQVIEVAMNVLSNLTNLSDTQSELITKYETKFGKVIDRQQEISKIWEHTLKRLELEMQSREQKIVELEDKLHGLKKSLKSNPNIVRAVSEAAPTETPQNKVDEPESEEPNQIMLFLGEEEESDEEFFDAEDDGSESGPEPAEAGSETVPVAQAREDASADSSEQTAGAADDARTEKTVINEPEEIKGSDSVVVNGFPLKNNKQLERYDKINSEATFMGYEDPIRTTLQKEDNRPKISLWSVLRSMVGKDMTKMTLPVVFNEPTSLLQRSTEVMEYASLLDKAASIDDSVTRMIYVAAFAASEYVSTVGRIAKPFNPLLGETFEYARPDQGYRVLVEQVSHHPPISALLAESASWSYYGEANVDTKFYGRSFDIKHLGTWFVELFPGAGVVDKKGNKTISETYSWKKIKNSVIGIIVGNPTIDNYGEMEIRNHTTGDYMSFSFKQRGWRASSAGEVKGEVFSNDGKLKYTVGGHWNSKIYAKDMTRADSPRFLIWEANPKTEMMFHLTNFAASLNAPQPHLLPVVACTDTRLRPDQRAMENGEYDLAATEKTRVENKQRASRKAREMSGEEYLPTFFARAKHPITGEPYWKYKDNYWVPRKEGKLKDYKSIF